MKLKISIILAAFFLTVIILAGCGDKIRYYLVTDAPHYPDSKILNLMALKNGFSAELETGDSGKKVLAFYKDLMIQSGWTIGIERGPLSSPAGDNKSDAFLACYKNNASLMVDIYKQAKGGKTQVAMYIGETHE